LALFIPKGRDNERRGENHLVLQESMLLTAGLKEKETVLLIVVDKKEETELEGAADLNNENGQTP
jgi:hypothetical protein